MSRSTIYRAITAGTFPAPRAIGLNMSRWLESEVAAWMADKIAATSPHKVAPAIKAA